MSECLFLLGVYKANQFIQNWRRLIPVSILFFAKLAESLTILQHYNSATSIKSSPQVKEG